MKFAILAILLISLSSCDIWDAKLNIKNNTNDTLFFSVKVDSLVKFSDQPLFYTDSNEIYRQEACLLPGETENYAIHGKWEKYIERIPDKKIKIIFFNKKLLDRTPWKEIVKNQDYSSKVELTVKELEKTNWLYTYSDTTVLKVKFIPLNPY